MSPDLIALVLAWLHHLLVFGLVAIAAVELVLISRDLDEAGVRRLVRIDLHYGAGAGLVLAVGICRVIWGGKSWDFYSQNPAFWVKMALFAAVGAASVPPTLAFIRWRRLGQPVGADQRAPVRRLVALELGLLFLIPLAAAAMARYSG